MNDQHALNPDLWNVAHREALLRFALQRVKDYGTAEDLVQETFLSAWHGRGHFRGACSERTWLTGILRNKIIDFYRRRARRPSVLSVDLLSSQEEGGDSFVSWVEKQPDPNSRDLPGAEVERAEFLGELEQALNRLPEKMGKAFRLREIHGRSTEEITRELDISKANLWVLIHRAKQALGETLSNTWGEGTEFGSRMAA